MQNWRRDWQSVRLIDRKAVDSLIRLSDSHFQFVFRLALQFDDDDSDDDDDNDNDDANVSFDEQM